MPHSADRKALTRLLLVTEDDQFLGALKACFCEEGYEVASCANLGEAQEILENTGCAVAVLDISRPDQDPSAFFAWLRQKDPLLEVVVLSAQQSFALAKNDITLRAFAYVEKGAALEELRQHVHRAFRARLLRYAEQLDLCLAESTVELARLRETFRQVVDRSAYGIVIVDSNGLVRYVNPAAQDLLGGNTRSLLNRPFVYATTHNDISCVSMQRADGRHAMAEIRTVCIDWEGGNAKLVSLIDVTDQQRAEEERRRVELQAQQSQRLETLGVLAGGIAHDFNNLLTSIIGNARLILTDISPVSPIYSSVEQIDLAGQRAADLCNQMLAYSKMGKGPAKPIDVTRLIRAMVHLLEVSIVKKAMLRYDLADKIAAIEADPSQIQQLVMNLVTNASDALGDSPGGITIATGNVVLTRADIARLQHHEELAEGECVYLDVTDTGSGMDYETMSKVFDPFFTTKSAGRGFGLASIRGIVRTHKGGIEMRSAPGLGTTVRVLFSASSRAAEPEKEPEVVTREVRGSETVLVADDDEWVRALAVTILERAGFRTLTAKDGREAVEMFRRHASDIDVVLLDLTMPELSGEEAMAAIRHLKPTVPVVLSSGYNELESTLQEHVDESVAFVRKPYRPNELTKRIKEVLTKRD